MNIARKRCVQCGERSSETSTLNEITSAIRCFEPGRDAARQIVRECLACVCDHCAPAFFPSLEFDDDLFLTIYDKAEGMLLEPMLSAEIARTSCDICESEIGDHEPFYTIEPTITLYILAEDIHLYRKPDHILRPYFMIQICASCKDLVSLQDVLLEAMEVTIARQHYINIDNTIH